MASDLRSRLPSPDQDEADATPWHFDPALLADLRFDAASDALDSGHPALALVEAEQLLARQPDDLDAMTLVGRAAISLGDGPMAAAALARVVGEDGATADAWALYSLALSLGFHYEEGEGAAREALRLDPTNASAWYHLALAQERIGEELAARRSFARAHGLAPEVLPRPRVWSERVWRQCLEAARDRLPMSVRVFYQGVPVAWRDLPDAELSRGGADRISPFAGAAALGPADDSELPRAVVLTRRNLARTAARPADLIQRLEDALAAVAFGWMRGD